MEFGFKNTINPNKIAKFNEITELSNVLGQSLLCVALPVIFLLIILSEMRI